MGKIRRKFEVEFKRRLVEQIETGQMTLSAAARQYQISPSVIQRWRTQYEANQLVDRPSSRERALEAENERLKAKVGDLVMQIDHQKKLQSWMKRNRNVDTAVITGKNWDRYRKGHEMTGLARSTYYYPTGRSQTCAIASSGRPNFPATDTAGCIGNWNARARSSTRNGF